MKQNVVKSKLQKSQQQSIPADHEESEFVSKEAIDNHPKEPLNLFFIMKSWLQKQVEAKKPGMTYQEMLKEASTLYGELGDEAKAPFVQEQLKQQNKYNQELEGWRKKYSVTQESWEQYLKEQQKKRALKRKAEKAQVEAAKIAEELRKNEKEDKKRQKEEQKGPQNKQKESKKEEQKEQHPKEKGTKKNDKDMVNELIQGMKEIKLATNEAGKKNTKAQQLEPQADPRGRKPGKSQDGKKDNQTKEKAEKQSKSEVTPKQKDGKKK